MWEIIAQILLVVVIVGLFVIVWTQHQRLNTLESASLESAIVSRTNPMDIRDAYIKRVVRLEVAQKGTGNVVSNLDARLAVIEAAFKDCEDCDDDKETPDDAAMGTTGDIGSTGDVPARIMDREGPTNLRGESVAMSDLLPVDSGEGGASTPDVMTAGQMADVMQILSDEADEEPVAVCNTCGVRFIWPGTARNHAVVEGHSVRFG